MNRLTLIAAAVFGLFRRKEPGVSLGRHTVRDVAYAYRMPAGFQGDVNRMHPASIEPCAIDQTLPPETYGIPVIIDATSKAAKRLAAAQASDTVALKCWGWGVRPFPFQQEAATNYGAIALGAATPPKNQPLDVLGAGYIMVKCNSGTPVKSNPVYIWCAASTGAHVLGGVEAAASAGNTVQVLGAYFNGGADSTGIVEIRQGL